MKNTNDKIVFANKRQLTLFVCELSGQLSDGYWENARPFDHFKRPTSANVSFSPDEAQQGKNFYARKYNFTNLDLLEAVGERMIFMVKVIEAFPNIDLETLHSMHMDNADEVLNWELYASRPSPGVTYWSDKVAKALTVFGATSTQELKQKLIDATAKVDYTMKDLRKDLNQMKAIWKKDLPSS